ncbi:DUF2147 domain-containing protein [Gynurincola endophyticus]|uniref:DUF2147 domain-containing protein n=1 Tax=Gynurincola endophyticus TaxID=2479004 RepID=UPI000F8C3A1B|nr:DUF2147 domain-containing protein [Gynurincola endophyticus]
MRLLVSLILLIGTTLSVTAQNKQAIVGIWFNQEKDGKIQIYELNGKYFGKLIWLKDAYEADGTTPRKDSKNKDAKLRNRSLVNTILLTDFEFDKNKWTNGQIYDPKSGNTYKCEMKLDGARLDVRGYVGAPMFGRTTVFTRAE